MTNESFRLEICFRFPLFIMRRQLMFFLPLLAPPSDQEACGMSIEFSQA